MEDLNQIQEFFSKPLEEISTDSVAMKQQYLLTEPVQIAYTDSFGTGMTGAAGVLHKANVGYFIGEEDAYIIVLPGGTFYVSEDGEVAMKIYPIRDQSDEFGAALAKTPFAPKYEDWKDSLRKAPVKEANVSWSTIHSSPPESDLIASDIQKAMNQNKGDEAIIHQLKIARRKMNVGDLKKAKEIVSRYLMRGIDEVEIGDKVKIDKDYGGGKGKIEDKVGSFVIVNGKSYHESDVEKIDLQEETPADDGIAAAGGGTPADQGKVAAKLKEGTSKYRKGYSNQKGFSPQLVSPENPRGETSGLTTDTMNKILMKVIQDLDELKQLGEGMIEEKLCKKGQAYRKKRMAAGEKSSAYLNGRAVKVCKGQMKG